MTTRNPARLQAAKQLLARFRAAGRPSGGAKPDQVTALQRSPVGWPVTRDVLVQQLTGRLTGTNTPSQVSTSYCGPAAFLYCVQEDRPDIYVAYALSLWLRGRFDFRTRIGAVDVEANSQTMGSMAKIQRAHADAPMTGSISELDWMTMASLSASTRPWFAPGHGATPDQVFKSITYPWVLKRWFASAGSRPVADSMGFGAMKSGLLNFVNLMRFWSTHWLVLQIDSTLITGGKVDTMRNRHWVVVDPHRMPRARHGPNGAVVPLGDLSFPNSTICQPMASTTSGRVNNLRRGQWISGW